LADSSLILGFAWRKPSSFGLAGVRYRRSVKRTLRRDSESSPSPQ